MSDLVDRVPPGRLYGRRRARPLRPGQQRLKAELLPRLNIELPAAGKLDPASLFPRPVEAVWLEIGFGGGEHLAEQAERHPTVGFIGSEVFEDGIVRLLGETARRDLTNIRLFTGDARLLLAALPPASLGRVFILFPDPWPKRRHHKRRLVAPATLDLLGAAMKDGDGRRLVELEPAELFRHEIPAGEGLPSHSGQPRYRRPGTARRKGLRLAARYSR